MGYSMNPRDLKHDKAYRRRNQLKNIAYVFRFIEIFAILVFVSKFTPQFPIVVKNSSEYFRGLSVFLASPHTAFIIGNLIVITLLAKSGQFSSESYGRKSPEYDLYEEFVQQTVKNRRRYEICCQDKHIIGEKSIVAKDAYNAQDYRIKSEKLKPDSCKKSRPELKRTETEKEIKSICADEGCARKLSSKDELSNEEFRRRIEAFIARQQRLRKEEELSVI